MLDIGNIQNKAMLCNEGILASAAISLGRRFEMMFSEVWNFYYFNNDIVRKKEIGKMIFSGEPWNMELSLEKYHGIHIDKYADINPEKILEISRNELKNNRPTVTYFDQRFLPGKADNIKVESSGNKFPAFILGINNNGVYCNDIHDLKRTVLVPFDDFTNACEKLITFSIVSDEVKNLNWKEVLLSNIPNMREGREYIFDSMNELGKHITTSLDLEAEMKGFHDYNHVPLLSGILSVGRARALFSTYLTYLAEISKDNSLLEYAQNFDKLYEKWKLIFASLCNIFYTANYNKRINDKIGARILEIAEMEQNQAKSLIELIKGKSTLKSNVTAKESKKFIKEVKEFIYLDLSYYMNNRGFEYPEYIDKDVKFNGSLSCILENGFPDDHLIDIGEMKFKLPNIKNDKYDNVFCAGQSITIPQECYLKLMVLGCAEWGSFSDYMICEFEDGSQERIPLELSDWWSPTPIYGETIAWSGRCAIKTPEGVEFRPENPVHLFSKGYTIQSDKNITKIKLPDGPFHIFALTFGR